MTQLTRSAILKRALADTCPNCGGRGLFATRYRMHESCPHCRLPMEKEDGWSLGAIPLNYAITCVFWILPVSALFLFGIVTLIPALVVAGIGCLVLPVLTYRFSKRLWLGIYYLVLPHEMSDHHIQQRDAR